MLRARFAKIGAEINQAGCEASARSIHHCRALGRRQASAAIGNQPIADHPTRSVIGEQVEMGVACRMAVLDVLSRQLPRNR